MYLYGWRYTRERYGNFAGILSSNLSTFIHINLVIPSAAYVSGQGNQEEAEIHYFNDMTVEEPIRPVIVTLPTPIKRYRNVKMSLFFSALRKQVIHQMQSPTDSS